MEFREFRDQFVQIDRMLDEGGIETTFLQLVRAENPAAWADADAKQLQRLARPSALALRCNVARVLTGLSFRDFAVRAADSSLLQWFLRIGEVDYVQAPAKSTLERFSKWVSAETMTQIHLQLVTQAVTPAQAGAAQPLNLSEPVDATEVFLDRTCLKATLHFPVDWVLLRDAARTLMKATVLIRREDLKQRMPQEPLRFLSDMNKLAMAMSANRRRPDAKQQRKRTLRQRKALEKKIARHARAHRERLAAHWAETELSEQQAQAIIARIDHILVQLPAAIAQAHERIIGERPVANADKILSLYEADVEVLKRGKAGAEVEFGNKLWLGETPEGLIVDYTLLPEAKADTALVLPSVQRLCEEMKLPVGAVWGDRACSARRTKKAWRSATSKAACVHAIRPSCKGVWPGKTVSGRDSSAAAAPKRASRSSKTLSPATPAARRASRRARAVGWAVLAHNLWVLARLKLTQDRQAAEAGAAKAA